jgi:hypothetical protein
LATNRNPNLKPSRSTPQIVSPLKFIRSRRPTTWVKVDGSEKKIVHPDVEDAEILAKHGHGLSLKRLAERVYAEDVARGRTE